MGLIKKTTLSAACGWVVVIATFFALEAIASSPSATSSSSTTGLRHESSSGSYRRRLEDLGSFLEDIFLPFLGGYGYNEGNESSNNNYNGVYYSGYSNSSPYGSYGDDVYSFVEETVDAFDEGLDRIALDEFLEDLGLPNFFEQSIVNVSCSNTTAVSSSTNNATATNTTATPPPPCAYNQEGDVGVWACRGLYNPINGTKMEWNACVNPNGGKGLVTDTCGCCNSTCPIPCPCECTLDDGSAGVLVNTPGSAGFISVLNWFLPDELDFDTDEMITKCIAIAKANTMLARPGENSTCVAETECTQ
jgi:hypothetical protein